MDTKQTRAGSRGGAGVGNAGGAGAAPARGEEVGTSSCPCVGGGVQGGSGGGRGGWRGRPSGRERGGERSRAEPSRAAPRQQAAGQARGGGEERRGEARRGRQPGDGLVRRRVLEAESGRAAGAGAPAPQGGRRGRMSQEEILRKFIKRVQAMKDTDHNGEDNFASDFMVRGGGGRGGGGGRAGLPLPPQGGGGGGVVRCRAAPDAPSPSPCERGGVGGSIASLGVICYCVAPKLGRLPRAPRHFLSWAGGGGGGGRVAALIYPSSCPHPPWKVCHRSPLPRPFYPPEEMVGDRLLQN